MDITSACPVAFLKVTVQGQKLVSLGIAAIRVCALFSSQLSCLKYRKCSKHIFNLLCWKYSILHFYECIDGVVIGKIYKILLKSINNV